jgi:hypothetical protein
MGVSTFVLEPPNLRLLVCEVVATTDLSQGNVPDTCQTITLASMSCCPIARATEMR